jgi:hypothetical protein
LADHAGNIGGIVTKQLTGRTGKQRAGAGTRAATRADGEDAGPEMKVLAPGEQPDLGDPGDDELEADDYAEPVPESLTFTTKPRPEQADAGEEELAGPEEVRFMLDGEEMVAIRPASASFVFLSLVAARSRSDPDKAADVINFLDDCFDQPTAIRIAHRLRDRADPFGFENLMPIMEKLLEIWAPPQQRARPARHRTRRR